MWLNHIARAEGDIPRNPGLFRSLFSPLRSSDTSSYPWVGAYPRAPVCGGCCEETPRTMHSLGSHAWKEHQGLRKQTFHPGLLRMLKVQTIANTQQVGREPFLATLPSPSGLSGAQRTLIGPNWEVSELEQNSAGWTGMEDSQQVSYNTTGLRGGRSI